MLEIVIADNEAIIRDGIKLIVEQDNEIKVTGCALDGLEAYELCKKSSPDLVLMDIVMPVCDGIEGVRLIKSLNKPIKVLMLTTFYDEEKISLALNNGADGYVLKDISKEELVSTIKSTVKGLRVIHQNVFDTVLKHFNRSISFDKPGENTCIANLTKDEKTILRLIAQGKTNKEIASIIHLSQGRVRNIITALLGKLGLKDRTQLAVFAVKNNLLDENSEDNPQNDNSKKNKRL